MILSSNDTKYMHNAAFAQWWKNLRNKPIDFDVALVSKAKELACAAYEKACDELYKVNFGAMSEDHVVSIYQQVFDNLQRDKYDILNDQPDVVKRVLSIEDRIRDEALTKASAIVGYQKKLLSMAHVELHWFESAIYWLSLVAKLKSEKS